MRIIVVEDDPQISSMYRAVLEAEGCEVVGPLHGPAALDDASWDGAKAAVIDVLMPDVSGLDVLEYLADRWPLVRRVVATALEVVPSEVERLADVMLRKPFDADDLVDAIR